MQRQYTKISVKKFKPSKLRRKILATTSQKSNNQSIMPEEAFLKLVDGMITPKHRKRFKKNMVRFLIGLLLISICYIYTLAHPAPKVSMEYGIKQLSERMMLFWYKIKHKDPNLLKEKYMYEDVYQDMLNIAEGNTCISQALVDAIQQKSLALRHEPNKNLAQNLS